MRTVAGKIVYLNADRKEWGRESFSISVHDRGRTIRTWSELDNALILRDTNWSLDANWKPLEGFARVQVDGVTEGHSWYRVQGDTVECEAMTREQGRASLQVQANHDIEFLGFHSITSDALTAMIRGRECVGEDRMLTGVTNSYALLGDKGLLAYLVTPQVSYQGPERVSVIAGDFMAEHFTVCWSDVVPNCFDFWVTGPDCIFLRMIGDDGGISYELSELED